VERRASPLDARTMCPDRRPVKRRHRADVAVRARGRPARGRGRASVRISGRSAPASNPFCLHGQGDRPFLTSWPRTVWARSGLA